MTTTSQNTRGTALTGLTLARKSGRASTAKRVGVPPDGTASKQCGCLGKPPPSRSAERQSLDCSVFVDRPRLAWLLGKLGKTDVIGEGVVVVSWDVPKWQTLLGSRPITTPHPAWSPHHCHLSGYLLEQVVYFPVRSGMSRLQAVSVRAVCPMWRKRQLEAAFGREAFVEPSPRGMIPRHLGDAPAQQYHVPTG